MPPQPKHKGRIQIKIMGLPSPSGSPRLGPHNAPQRSPAFRVMTPKMSPMFRPLDDMSSISSLEDDDRSVTSSEDEERAAEELHAVIDTFKHQMHQIYVASQAAEHQVGRLLTRAKEETAPVVVEPLRPQAAVAAWLAGRGLPVDPSLEEFLGFCLDAAEAQDLETRTILFSQTDAAVLTKGQRRVTVFEMLRLLPGLFH
jgi:hypothetical protein